MKEDGSHSAGHWARGNKRKSTTTRNNRETAKNNGGTTRNNGGKQVGLKHPFKSNKPFHNAKPELIIRIALVELSRLVQLDKLSASTTTYWVQTIDADSPSLSSEA